MKTTQLKIAIIGSSGHVGSSTAAAVKMFGNTDGLRTSVVLKSRKPMDEGVVKAKADQYSMIANSRLEDLAYDMHDAKCVMENKRLCNSHAHHWDTYSYEAGSRIAPLYTTQYKDISGADIVVISAGVARGSNVSRDAVLPMNMDVMHGILSEVKRHCPGATVIIGTNPVERMVMFAVEKFGFDPAKVMGLGSELDGIRKLGRIREALGAEVPLSTMSTFVYGEHGERMVLAPESTIIGADHSDLGQGYDLKAMSALAAKANGNGDALRKIAQERDVTLLDLLNFGIISPEQHVKIAMDTVQRGQKINQAIGHSAFLAPGLVLTAMLNQVVAGDGRTAMGVSAYVNGEYGHKGIALGVPAVLCSSGIGRIVDASGKLTAETLAGIDRAADAIEADKGKILAHEPG